MRKGAQVASVLGDKVLLIANPAAQNGAGAHAADRAASLLRAELGELAVELLLTQAPGHAESAAASAAATSPYSAIVALGGDGVVHEVANGILRLPEGQRPPFGLIPVGSGNDYARTLGMSSRSIGKAVRQLLAAGLRRFDVGRCNGRYFTETLSFGLDAAIAIETVERRRRTGKTGTMLYLESGMDHMLHHLDRRSYRAEVAGYAPMAASRVLSTSATQAGVESDSITHIEGESYLFAVQIGRTYGGGFCVCPEARVDDGLLDICIAHPPLSSLHAALIFLLAKEGHHTRFRQIEFFRASGMRISFDAPLAVQMDGERFDADSFDIKCIPAALNVLVA